MIVSVSGIRGVLNQDVTPAEFAGFARNFARITESNEFLLARDTRSTGEVVRRAVAGALLSCGAKVIDLGVISTPALYRESRTRNKAAIMITASHNEPQFNGLKFLVDGAGIGKDVLDRIVGPRQPLKEPFRPGELKHQVRPSYNNDLVQRFGVGSCEGVRVALDLGGGAAITHAPEILKRLGCEVVSINDTLGVFNREVDPMADRLLLLQKVVRGRGCAIGLGFDCDGDRLAIVDDRGRKRSGDYMLTLALSHLLPAADDKSVVVSVDTTQAIEEIVGGLGGSVFRSKVGEANVVAIMKEKNVGIGGEGSSGGLIDGSFNYCRDSMLAALTIIKALKESGTGIYDEVRSYFQARVAFHLERSNALQAIRTLAEKNKNPDGTDGLKLKLSDRSWVLIRPSGTEDVVRVSAEAKTKEEADEIAETYARKLRELAK